MRPLKWAACLRPRPTHPGRSHHRGLRPRWSQRVLRRRDFRGVIWSKNQSRTPFQATTRSISRYVAMAGSFIPPAKSSLLPKPASELLPAGCKAQGRGRLNTHCRRRPAASASTRFSRCRGSEDSLPARQGPSVDLIRWVCRWSACRCGVGNVPGPLPGWPEPGCARGARPSLSGTPALSGCLQEVPRW